MTQIALTSDATEAEYLRFAQRFPNVVYDYFKWNYGQSQIFVSEREQRRLWRKRHVCTYSLIACIDERMSDMLRKLGLMVGIPLVSRSPGCLEANAGNQLQQKRHWAHVEHYCGKGDKLEVHIATCHYAKGSDHHGCAARDNNTAQYMADMIQYAKSVNTASEHAIIAFAMGWDTNLDAATIHGPNGLLDTEDYARDPKWDDPAMLQAEMQRELQRIFPRERGLIHHKKAQLVDAFFEEFADLLVHHIGCIRQKIIERAAMAGLPEKEPHTGLLTFIGRPLDMEPPVGSAFLVEDIDSRLMAKSIGIPMKFMCRNALEAAVRSGNESDFVIPFIISIPHRDGNAGFKKVTSRNIAEMVNLVVRTRLPGIISHFKQTAWWKQMPEHIQRIAINEAVERVCTFPCVHDEQTRLFIPVS